jgi:hypothetical protein
VQPGVLQTAGLLIALFGGSFTLFLGHAVAHPDQVPPIEIAFGVLVFGCLLWYPVSLARASLATVTVDERGLSRRLPGGAPQFIPWEDVESVRAEDGRQRLVVQDRKNAQQIALDYQLMDFDALRKAIEDRARFRNDHRERQTVFRRSLGVDVFFGGFACVSAVLAAVIPWAASGSLFARMFVFAVFGALALGLAILPCMTPFRVEIRLHELEVRSVVKTQVIPFREIAAVELSTRNKSNAAAIRLTRSDKSVVGVGGYFRGGSLAVYEAIQAALAADRGGAGAKVTPGSAGSAGA